MDYPLSFAWHDVGDVVVFRAAGYLNDQTEQAFEQAVRQATARRSRLVLEASEIAHVSSIGFGLLIALASDLRQRGGDLVLAALSPNLQRVLTLAFGTYFQQYGSTEAAIAAFLSPRADQEVG